MDAAEERRRHVAEILAGRRSEPNTFHRAYAADMEIRRSGDGRTVVGYCAMFDAPYEVQDRHGHYFEQIHRSAFERELSTGNLPLVLYNHGLGLSGQSDALAMVPLGRAVEIRPDGKGLLTVAHYNKTKLADSVLEAIRAGDITSQSFRGRIVRSTPDRVPRVRSGERLPTITRMELGLSDFGPSPVAMNADAKILAVRGDTSGAGRTGAERLSEWDSWKLLLRERLAEAGVYDFEPYSPPTNWASVELQRGRSPARRHCPCLACNR